MLIVVRELITVSSTRQAGYNARLVATLRMPTLTKHVTIPFVTEVIEVSYK